MKRRTLFETRHRLFKKNLLFVVKSCFLYTKLNCRNSLTVSLETQNKVILILTGGFQLLSLLLHYL